MYYRKALELQAFLDMAKDEGRLSCLLRDVNSYCTKIFTGKW